MKNWTKRFEEKFSVPHVHRPTTQKDVSLEHIKEFITEEIETAFEDGYREGCKKTGTYEQGRLEGIRCKQEALKEIVPIEKHLLYLTRGLHPEEYIGTNQAGGWNACRQEIIDKIQKQG